MGEEIKIRVAEMVKEVGKDLLGAQDLTGAPGGVAREWDGTQGHNDASRDEPSRNNEEGRNEE